MINANSQYAIETFSLTKIFSDWWGREKVCAVDDLNLKIKTNEVFGLLGPNGSGKTTTIKLLLGLLHPTKGYSSVLGGKSSDLKVTSKIGFLPEESYLYKYLNAVETLDFYGRIFGLSAKVRKARIEALLEMVGLNAVARRPIGTYSKGMARRIGLAQALINDPDLLILDEPTSGLDPIGTRQIKDLIHQLSKRGKTILLCSHLLADVEDVCDRISILYGGKVQSQGKVDELLLQSDKSRIIAQNLSDDALEKIKAILDSQQAKYDIDSPREKLESYFIDTVVKAQKSKLTTSGAVTQTEFDNFLSPSHVIETETVLDKLVSDEPAIAEPVKTAAPIKIEVASNENLLQNLTNDQPLKKEESQAGQTDRVKNIVPKPDQKVNKSLLEDLTHDNSQGQDKDA